MKYIIYSVIIFAIISLFGCSSSDNGLHFEKWESDTIGHDFKLTISTDKQEYEFGDKVFITYRLVNTGIMADTIIKTFFNSNHLSRQMNCVYEKNDTLKWSGYDATYSKLDYVILKPGEEITAADNLNFNLGNVSLFFGGRYFKAGVYNLDCGYSFLSPSQFSKKYITSNRINFSVKKATDEDLNIFNQLKKFEKTVLPGPYKQETMQEYIDSARFYIRKYPQSIFVQPVFDVFAQNREWFHYKYDETLLEDIELLIENNPDSDYNKYYIHDCINLIIKKLGGKEKAKEYLLYLKEKFKNEKLNGIIDDVSAKDESLNK
ncbi:MAG: hypothetical protein PHN88_10160 [Ignavibacteria bacterium]|nr:hypothetical protein [Ignavibacteria bacterium]